MTRELSYNDPLWKKLASMQNTEPETIGAPSGALCNPKTCKFFELKRHHDRNRKGTHATYNCKLFDIAVAKNQNCIDPEIRKMSLEDR